MEQKHLQVRQCLILSFLDVIFWNEHYDKGPDPSNVLQHELFRFMFIDI